MVMKEIIYRRMAKRLGLELDDVKENADILDYDLTGTAQMVTVEWNGCRISFERFEVENQVEYDVALKGESEEQIRKTVAEIKSLAKGDDYE